MDTNSTYNQLVIYNGYPLSFAAALLLHIMLLAGLLYLQTRPPDNTLELVQPPTIIKALFIDENPQITQQREQERQRLERLEQQRITRQQEEQRQAELERQQQQQEAERQALIERQELERLRAEQEQRDREQRDREQLEQQRQRELEEERIRQQQLDAAQRQQQLEQQQQQQAEAARSEYELVQSATAIIQQYVEQQWSRPPSARNGMRAVLRIEMLPTGDVTSVNVVQSSNDAAFDRSAETAVYRAAPFSELQELPIRVFNENFRTLSLIFQPEDLLN
ncbi:MAG: TonB family protein [Pseudohongiellaceae bacterium]